jgi:Glycosyltransferase family 92
LLSFFKNNPPTHYLSLLAPVKFEDEFIEEFVSFYLLQGVDHFYFYDNENEIPLTTTLAKYLEVCTIIKIEGDNAQIRAYQHWYQHFKHQTHWVAIFDVDEFVFPKKHETLKAFLRDFEAHDAVAINWKIFGNGPHIKKPSGLVIENYLFSEGKQHNSYKCVVKAAAIKRLDHPHKPVLKVFRQIVNANRNVVKGYENSEPTTNIIQLNHYYSKSEEEYAVKLNRKRADTGKTRVEHTENLSWVYDEHIRTSKVRESDIWEKYGQKLKELLASRG